MGTASLVASQCVAMVGLGKLSGKYYINRSDSNRAVDIQTAVAAAVGQYTAWQRAIGRDINPSKLGEMVMAAGAKRVEMAAPVHQIVGAKSVAVLNGQAVHYGGLEDD